MNSLISDAIFKQNFVVQPRVENEEHWVNHCLKRHSLLITQVMCIGSILYTLLPSEVSFKVLFKLDLAALSLTAELFQITLAGTLHWTVQLHSSCGRTQFYKGPKVLLTFMITLEMIFPLMSLKSFPIVTHLIRLCWPSIVSS